MKKVRIRNPDAKLVTIYTLSDPVVAEMIKNTLLDHEIECEIDGIHQAGFTGALSIWIVVRESDADRAHEVIETHYPQSG